MKTIIIGLKYNIYLLLFKLYKAYKLLKQTHSIPEQIFGGGITIKIAG